MCVTSTAPCNSQDKGMCPCRQRVCRLSEHADKLCRLMAHQTVTLNADNPRSAVQPKKKKKTERHRKAILKVADVGRYSTLLNRVHDLYTLS